MDIVCRIAVVIKESLLNEYSIQVSLQQADPVSLPQC